MNKDDFKKNAHDLIDWMADYYFDDVKSLPVRSQVKPGAVRAQIPTAAPMEAEGFQSLFDDFRDIVIPGMTHWQHPRFFAYFPANVSPPSVLAEMLTSIMGANAMLWETSPAATELEEAMMNWLKDMMALPTEWSGVIQDTASSAAFCAVLAARERATDWRVNESGLQASDKLAFYTSAEAHSSVEKAVKMAGLGKSSIRLVPTDDDFAMKPSALISMIEDDRKNGTTPTMLVATVGTTGVGASDPLEPLGLIARSNSMYFHVDAAWAGSAMVCPEYRYLMRGIELADSYAFNPHKWMGVNFDCTAHFVKDADTLKRTLTILPEYLKTREGNSVTDYRDWGIQLGRRMRALKLWFVIRSYGVEGLQAMFRNHIEMTEELAEKIFMTEGFELVTKPNLSLLTFRKVEGNAEESDQATEALLTKINDDGFTYLTRTVVNGRPVIRFQIGQINTSSDDVMTTWERIVALS
ncbi:pyridoxal-dependent decarboxylase [Kordiimonas sp. SCSIO 12610]|uniref:pyridoxal phosphate-dependent decarboxylase family protein n=1 Tax=Kordiimonas sp. SCSIO 12610 TaxID=2829597 RepID=UPI002109A8CB|nr:pyridoxal-dependent decarboxylase [Kordiimonas sp. SCSIO 12610]UTW55063.1 aspartate aminotransferase family protein [Kordiimonas sp. SCSIO 12610]